MYNEGKNQDKPNARDSIPLPVVDFPPDGTQIRSVLGQTTSNQDGFPDGYNSAHPSYSEATMANKHASYNERYPKWWLS